MGYGYSMDALVYDGGTNSWSLRPDYDFTQHRVEISITDDDGYLDGDINNNEVGDDTNQTGTVTDMDGNLIASGQVYDELFYEIQSPTGDIAYLEVIEINGAAVGFFVTTPLETGISYTETNSGNVNTYDDDPLTGDTRLLYSELESVPCFCQGTTLTTKEGEQPVDWIRPGDQIMTKDHGFQPVLWVGRTTFSASKLESTPSLQPIKIAAHSIDAQTPTRDLLLSPEHRVLLKSPKIELLFGIDEVFAPIKAVANSGNIVQTLPQHDISYYHVLFQNHEIVLAEGLWVESFFPGNMALAALPAKKQAQIRAALGPNTDEMETARLCLKPWEVNLLVPRNTAQALPCNCAA